MKHSNVLARLSCGGCVFLLVVGLHPPCFWVNVGPSWAVAPFVLRSGGGEREERFTVQGDTS